MSINVAVTVKVLDRDIKVGCPKEEEATLLESAKYLNEQMKIVRDTGVMGADKIAIMAALNITRDLLKDKAITADYAKLSAGLNNLLDQLDDKLNELQHPS